MVTPAFVTSGGGMVAIPFVSSAGEFQVAHGLGSIPYAAVPVEQGPGKIRLRSQPTHYDAQYVYLSGSADGIPGTLFVWGGGDTTPQPPQVGVGAGPVGEGAVGEI